jgi:hypothetical protein
MLSMGEKRAAPTDSQESRSQLDFKTRNKFTGLPSAGRTGMWTAPAASISPGESAESIR